MTVYAVAIVDSEGDPGTIYIPGGTFEDEGAWYADPKKTVVHVTTQMEDYDRFAKQHYYKDGAWKERPERTGDYYIWKNEAWEFNSDLFWSEVREDRNRRLYFCDWTQLPDCKLSLSKQGEWTEYRSALRGVPQTNSGATKLDEIVWPDKPS